VRFARATTSPSPGAQLAARWGELLDESITVREAMRDALLAPLQEAAEAIVASLDAGGKVLLCGNGGSAADAQHIAAELVGRFTLERRALAAVALTENVASITAISNDYGYEGVFARQLDGLARPGDVLLALSTSGTSANVLSVLERAGELEVVTVVMSGPAPNPAADLADIAVCIPASTTAAVQEGYLLAGHALCEVVEAVAAGS
jgi:D-sedoheptulose 7-phosphate isomerase